MSSVAIARSWCSPSSWLVNKPMAHVTYIARGGSTKRRRLDLQIHRAFVQWLDEARHRLLIQVRIVHVSRHYLELDVDAFGGCVTVGLSWSLSVIVTWKGMLMDMLWDEDVVIRRGSSRYYCGLCANWPGELEASHEEPRYYPARQAFWVEHLFEPWLEWTNGTLAVAKVLDPSHGCGFLGHARD